MNGQYCVMKRWEKKPLSTASSRTASARAVSPAIANDSEKWKVRWKSSGAVSTGARISSAFCRSPCIAATSAWSCQV